jgi:flavin reductase (DIM6/NTAB) family NADH-FMN oxidoreductase RutF
MSCAVPERAADYPSATRTPTARPPARGFDRDPSGKEDVVAEPFDALAAALDPPVVVVTVAAAGERAGCLVGFHSQSSIDPRHYAVWLSKANHTYRVALRSDLFAVHFLTAADLDVASHWGSLTGDDVDKFAGVELSTTGAGLPLLLGCPNRIVARRVAVLDDGGDHVCVTGDVLSAETPGPFRPLRLSAVDDIRAGHDPRDA